MNSFGDTMRAILRGQKTDDEIKNFLIDLNALGLTSDHVRTGVEIMRENMIPVDIPNAIDIVGTGGTGLHTLSISTATALVCAGAGVRVAKHGNRAASSLTGTADTLSELGVRLNVSPEIVTECVDKAGVGFLFAPNHHPAMRFVGPARKAIGKRTLFNLLGPISNPASTKRMLVGVNNDDWRHLMAKAFVDLDVEHVWVVHGLDGLDEITTTDFTRVSEVREGVVKEFSIHPTQYGIPMASIEELRGGAPEFNARRLLDVIRDTSDSKDPYYNVVTFNAAAALLISGQVEDIEEGLAEAWASISLGRAELALNKLIEVSNA